MYNEKVMEVFKNPKHSGELADANGVGVVGNASCGDIMKVFLKIENDVVVDASFQTFGCTAAVATSSMAIQMIIGKPLDYARNLTNSMVVEELEGLPPQKIHCSVLAQEAIEAAIKDFEGKI